MKQWKWRSVLFVGLFVQGIDVYAQQQSTGPDSSAIDNLRERQPTDLDNKIIDDWVRAAIDGLKSDLASGSPTESADSFVARFASQYGNAKNSVAFNRRFAERAAGLFLAEYKRGADLDPVMARAFARVLVDFAAEPTREALLAGLVFPDQAVRYLSAKAFVRIKADIAADARLTSVTVAAIGKAGAAEPNELTAAMIYEACAYPEHVADSVTAMLTMLDGRLDRMRKTAHGLGRSDLRAVRFFDSVSLDSNQKAEIVRRLAPLLRIYVLRYADENVSYSERAAVEETIDEVEALIRKWVSPSDSPVVSEKMQKGDDTAAIDMQIELNRWIGTDQDEGILNRSPWDVPRGAP